MPVKMTSIHQVMVEVLDVVGRAAQVEARNLNNGGSSTDAAQITGTSTSSSPSATSTQTNSGGGGGGQSPLLFFVALGFGVVFTNLWIIVGVKYCFRYNARNRALARGENPDDVPLDHVVPGRPHRRRREKKLMTMEEVNERFPMMKYKNWMLGRANKGLSTAGGVTAPPTRPGTLRDAEGVIPTSPVDIKHTIEERPITGVTSAESTEIGPVPVTSAIRRSMDSTKSARVSQEENTSDHARIQDEAKNFMPTLHEVQTSATIDHYKAPLATEGDSEDEEDHIADAVPVEMLDHPGDACAICIDTLEQDDDIRGLTCGHAFHAVCLDPWLTSRRACCPLCKADYYVPKPRPEGEAVLAESRERGGRRGGRAGITQPTQVYTGWRGITGHGRLVLHGLLPTGNATSYGTDGYGSSPSSRVAPVTDRHRRAVAEAQAAAAARNGGIGRSSDGRIGRANPFSRISMPRFGLPSRRQQESVGAAAPGNQTSEVTPSQLEDGVIR